MTCELWRPHNLKRQAKNYTLPPLREEAVLKFVRRAFAAIAIVVLATFAAPGATPTSLVSSKHRAAATHLARPEPFKPNQPKAAPKNGATRPPTAANVQNRAAPAASQIPTAAPNGGAPSTPMRPPLAVNVARTGSAARVSSPVPGSQGIRFGAPPAVAARDGAVNGTNVRPHTSPLAVLGGAETRKGTALVSGTTLGPKRH
jgi:hypothetical protein